MTTRANIIRGPAVITFDSVKFFTEDDITLEPVLETFKLPSSIHGDLDERLDNIMWRLTFTPEGFWSYRTVLCPHHTPVYGSSIFGAADKNVVIQTVAGQQITLNAGAITQMPELRLGATKSFWGSVEMTCIGKENTAWSDDAKRAAIAGVALSDDTYNTSGKLTIPYAAALGSIEAPWNAIKTQDGWTISFDMAAEPIKTDDMGVVDMTLGTVGVMARCTPVGVTEAQVLALLKIQGTGIARGVSLAGNANDLLIQGATPGDPLVTIKNAAPKTAGFRFGHTALRIGELGFVSVARVASGAAAQLFDLDVVPTPP